MAHLIIKGERLGDIREIIAFLIEIENIYNNLHAFEFIINETKEKYASKEMLPSGKYYYISTPTRKTLKKISKPADIILPEDRLLINRIVVESPGIWELIGNLAPFETIRKYLCDRHERKKDREYRTAQEKDKGDLENEKLRLEIVKDKIEILKRIGIPEEVIRTTVLNHVNKPLGKIDIFQDRGLIGKAELKDAEKRGD